MRISLRKKSQKGSALVECALCLGLLWAPLLMGTWVVGFGLIRSVQVTQICRDAGHMYSQGTDFTLSGAQQLLASLAPSSIQITSAGNAVVYVSRITYVDHNLCLAGGIADSACMNFGHPVFTQWIPVGNTGLRRNGSTSGGAFGDPSSLADPATGNISQTNYLQKSVARADGFLTLMPSFTKPGQIAFVSEMFVLSSDFDFFQSTSTPGQYARSIF